MLCFFILLVLQATTQVTNVHAQQLNTATDTTMTDTTLSITATPSTTITVGTKIAPPFAMKDEDEQWTGISIDLLRLVASNLNLDVEFADSTLSELITDVHNGNLDASIAAISITQEREQTIDFTHRYFDSGLAIVTPKRYQPGWKSMLKALISPQFLATVFLLICVLSCVGVIVWALEAKRNSTQFGDSPSRGIGNGFWFAAVTMTTVGYGDKTPVTLAGRIVSVIWMFAALILTAFLTAQLTTILTAQQAENVVTGVADLEVARVGNLSGSSSQHYFVENGLQVKGFKTVEEGLEAITNNEIDAFVHDQPLLKWVVNRSEKDYLVLPDLFQPQSYAIAVQQGSPLREKINIALLDILTTPQWPSIKKKYLGE